MASTGDRVVSTAIRTSALAVVWLLGAAVVCFAVHAALTHDSGDFQWSGARMLAHGIDPYQTLLQQGHAEFLKQQYPPYLPLLYFMLLPLGVTPVLIAQAVWAGLNLVMYFVAARILGKAVLLHGWKLAIFVGLALSSQPLAMAIRNGQQTFLILLAAVLAMRARTVLPGGVALAVMLTKYSFSPVAAAFLLCKRRWWALALAAGIEVVALVGFCLVTGSGVVSALLGPVRVGQGMGRGAGDMRTLVRVLNGSGSDVLPFAAAFTAAVVLVWFTRRVLAEGHWVDALSCGALVALATLPHLLYDYVFLLPVLASAFLRTAWPRALLLVAISVIWYGWMFQSVNISGYHLTGVIEAMALLMVMLTVLVRSRPVIAAGSGAHGRVVDVADLGPGQDDVHVGRDRGEVDA